MYASKLMQVLSAQSKIKTDIDNTKKNDSLKLNNLTKEEKVQDTSCATGSTLVNEGFSPSLFSRSSIFAKENLDSTLDQNYMPNAKRMLGLKPNMSSEKPLSGNMFHWSNNNDKNQDLDLQIINSDGNNLESDSKTVGSSLSNNTISKDAQSFSYSSSSSSFPFTKKEFNSKKVFTNNSKSHTAIINTKMYDDNESVSSPNGSITDKDVTIMKDSDNDFSYRKIVPIFIGDLDPCITEYDLRHTFKEFKSLQSVKVCRSRFTGEPLGHGYLNFSNKEEAQEAIDKFNYTFIKAKEVRMMESLKNTSFRKNMGTNIFFSDLPLKSKNITTREFYDIFKKYGKILSCKLDKRKCIGFVYYENDSIASKVIQDYNNKELFGSIISCGIHFDKDVRNLPEFGTRVNKLDPSKVIKEKILTESNEVVSSLKQVSVGNQSKLQHPNAVFVIGLPKSFKNEETLNLFSEAGPIKSVHICPKYNTNFKYAFITFKKGVDCSTAIKLFDGKLVKGSYIKIGKAHDRMSIEAQFNSQYKDESLIKNQKEVYYSDFENYRSTVYLSNLSEICSEMFIMEFVRQKNIKVTKIKIKWFNEKSSTFSGYVVCRDEEEAKRFYSALNERLIGDTVIECSWEKQANLDLVVKEPSLPMSTLQSGSNGKLLRNPSITGKPKWTSVNVK